MEYKNGDWTPASINIEINESTTSDRRDQIKTAIEKNCRFGDVSSNKDWIHISLALGESLNVFVVEPVLKILKGCRAISEQEYEYVMHHCLRPRSVSYQCEGNMIHLKFN
jgi:hypothetical protein